MKWSFRLGRIAGIDVRVHATFLLLLAWVALSHYFTSGYEVAAALGAAAFILSVFGMVVLHELGHALTARRFGIGTRDITLLPIGGVAQLERMPEDPKQQLLVALAGPAVNVVLAIALFLAVTITGGGVALDASHLGSGSWLAQLMWVNVSLAVFNLLPAFPMDGGRVLRAALAMRTTPLRATQIAARVGRGMAWGLGGLGLFVSPMLVLVALFVWMGATAEQTAAERRAEVGPEWPGELQPGHAIEAMDGPCFELVDTVRRPGRERLYVVRPIPCRGRA
jgi:Zn-dependent protease